MLTLDLMESIVVFNYSYVSFDLEMEGENFKPQLTPRATVDLLQAVKDMPRERMVTTIEKEPEEVENNYFSFEVKDSSQRLDPSTDSLFYHSL